MELDAQLPRGCHPKFEGAGFCHSVCSPGKKKSPAVDAALG